MSTLFVYHVSSPQVPDKILTNREDIASTLADHGVRVSRLQVTAPVRPGASEQDVVETLRGDIDRLMAEPGHDALDVISADGGSGAAGPDTPLQEQALAVPQTLWMVDGQGLLSLHVGDYVYAILCERHDLVSVPGGVGHWFDSGERPRLCALRMYSGLQTQSLASASDGFASRFARLDDLA
ncbi:acireductone dioxygenase [Pseudomonas sp. JDS28PS106]|uniref:acireductone dioxygenase n=1 Tax=Pseudomonas sp. JDS28PS106 TaxID=2497235 RepID=UPI002FD6CB3F